MSKLGAVPVENIIVLVSGALHAESGGLVFIGPAGFDLHWHRGVVDFDDVADSHEGEWTLSLLCASSMPVALNT
jgi:hypothetical protein